MNMKNCLILLFVVLSCYNAVVVEGLKGGLRMNDQPAQSMTTERIPCTNNCDAPADPSIVETKEPLKGPFVGKVEFPANSNNLIAEGENVTVAKESHSKMISQHKGFQVDGVQFVQHYNSEKSHPNGGYVGTKYVEWSEPKMKVEKQAKFDDESDEEKKDEENYNNEDHQARMA